MINLTSIQGQHKLFKQIWNEDRIAKRSKLSCFIFPLVLIGLLLLVKIEFNPSTVTPPYVIFVAIILLSACFGGARAALFATIYSFIAALGLLFLPVKLSIATIETHILEALVFCIEALFLCYLIWSFQTQRKRNKLNNLMVKKANLLLQAREKEQENFVHMAAHELKSPVTVLKGYQQMITARLISNQQTEEVALIKKMDQQLDKLLHRIGDLLDLAKVNSATMKYNVIDFSITQCLQETLEDIKAAHPYFTIEQELLATNIIVNGDKERIQQVLINFLNNAIKYAKAEKYIKIKMMLVNNEVMVKVIDKGIGVPAEKQSYVFDRFYRVDNQATISKPGLGLGLFICKEIILQHQGKIGVESKDGLGSTFWFSLPIKR